MRETSGKDSGKDIHGPRVQRILPLLLLTVACSNELRPSDFTTGWSEPFHSDQQPMEEGLFPGLPLGQTAPLDDWQEGFNPLAQTEVFKDWREGHDPALPCPPEMAWAANSYCIDKWEGSLVEITAIGEVPFRATHRVENRLVRAQSRPGVMPQAYISGAEAQRACQMAGKRLCTSWEWWRACAGSKKMIYPYGTMHVARRCNEDRPMHPVVQLYGEDAGPKIWWVEPMNNPRINEQSATVAMTGARYRCVSEDGLFDMVGNVHEWTNDPSGTFHGGAYSGKIALGCQYTTTVHGFSYHDYSTGFRCCSDPDARANKHPDPY